MLNVKFYRCGEVDDSRLMYAVIASRYNGKWIYCLNKKRRAWEVPGGRREPGESISDTAKRELYEETGAEAFGLSPVCLYSVHRSGEDESFGMLFYADIAKLGDLPDTEIERIGFFSAMPEELSFPQIQPKLMEKVMQLLGIK